VSILILGFDNTDLNGVVFTGTYIDADEITRLNLSEIQIKDLSKTPPVAALAM